MPSDEDDWGGWDEISGLFWAERLILVSVVTVVVVGVAVAWNALSLASQALQAVRHKP